MAKNQYVNKIIYGGDTLLDLTVDTVTADKMLSGYKAHDKSGAQITGTCTYDADTSDADAADSEILVTKTAYVNGNKITGTMPNNGKVTGNISAVSEEYTVPLGYHDGSGKVSISAAEQSKIIADNIKAGVTILGVVGTCSPAEGVTAQEKTFTPTKDGGTVLPDTGVDYLSQVTVAAIPYTEIDNTAGGKTVTIA